jgi:UDP-glucose 4-epimerase
LAIEGFAKESTMSTPPTALVSGGTGFIGSHVAAALLQSGYHVRTVGRRPPEDARPAGMDHWQVDVASTELLDQVVGDVDVVIHTAGAATTKAGPQEMEEVNVGGTARLAEAAVAAGARRFVYVSTSSVYGTKVRLPQPVTEDTTCHPSPGYGETKLRAEQAVRQAGDKGLETAILRPTNVFGPGAIKLVASTILDAAIERYAGLATFEVPREPVELRMVHIDDVVDACLHVAESPQAAAGVFNLASGVYPSSHEIAQAVADEIGLELALSDAAEPGLSFERRQEVRAAMLAEGMRDKIVLSEQRLRVLRKANPNNRLSLQALADTGFQPRVTDVTKAVRELVRWYRLHGWIL